MNQTKIRSEHYGIVRLRKIEWSQEAELMLVTPPLSVGLSTSMTVALPLRMKQMSMY
jgi:hypothetical protein